MKKFIVMALCILLLLIAAVPTLAANETVIKVTADKTELQRGETVNFTVSISGDTPFTSVMVGLNFDSNVFEYVAPATPPSTVGSFMVVPYDGTATEVGLFGMTPATYNGVIQVITFKVKSNAPLKAVKITGEGASGSNADGSITVKFTGTEVAIGCKHQYPDKNAWSKVDGTSHRRVCTKCQTPEVEPHNWDDGTVKKEATCVSSGTTVYTCSDCNATKEETVKAQGHTWSNDCDTTCNREKCTYTRETTHKFSTEWSSNGEGHWHECTSCHQKKDEAKHTPGPAATEQKPQTCTVCNYVIASASSHTHAMSAGWIQDAIYHWHRCEKNGCSHVTDKTEHVYDNNCDVDCNICGYIRLAPHNYNPEWRGDTRGHWRVCVSCGADSEIKPHTPGDEATMDTPQICLDCQFIIKRELSHVHTLSEAWGGDDDSHWKSCTECGEADCVELHQWDAGVIVKQPTETEQGSTIKTCTVCGREKTEVLPALNEPNATTPQGGDAPGTPQENSQSGGFPWHIAGIAAAVLLLIGIILLVIEFVRSRKTNMHGKYSK